jgi:hypothetical protein
LSESKNISKNTLKTTLSEVDGMMDLNIHDPDFVSHNIPKAFFMLQKEYDFATTRMIKFQAKLELTEKEYLHHLKTKADLMLANKDEYNTYIAGHETINKLNMAIRLCERDLKSIENRIKIVMNLNFTVKNLIDWKNFKGGI